MILLYEGYFLSITTSLTFSRPPRSLIDLFS